MGDEFEQNSIIQGTFALDILSISWIIIKPEKLSTVIL
jgi:hypothetical protein